MAAVLALLGGAGCSLGDGTEPKPAKGSAREVAVVVDRLEAATAKGDWRSVCDDIFTARARVLAGGKDCPRQLRSDAGRVASPRIDVVRITLKGSSAAVRVRSRAAGQPPLEDVIELKREGGKYRIDSLKS
jgi:hypothetical protein